MPINPLDHPGEVFELGLLNPNPTSSKTKAGPVYRVSFEIEREIWDLFMEADCSGMLIAARASVVRNEEPEALETKPEPTKGPYGMKARDLIRSGFFCIHQVLDQLGGDEAYKSWVRTHPCVISGDYDYSERYPEGRCVYAHVLRSGGVPSRSGPNPNKPKYSGLPMTDSMHQLQGTRGELAAYERYLIHTNSAILEAPTVQDAKDWFNDMATKYLQQWALEAWMRLLQIETKTMADPVRVRAWADENGLADYLPKDY